jgi:hypothetical protein
MAPTFELAAHYGTEGAVHAAYVGETFGDAHPVEYKVPQLGH